jgi:hypothetical protein
MKNYINKCFKKMKMFISMQSIEKVEYDLFENGLIDEMMKETMITSTG